MRGPGEGFRKRFAPGLSFPELTLAVVDCAQPRKTLGQSGETRLEVKPCTFSRWRRAWAVVKYPNVYSFSSHPSPEVPSAFRRR
ncbi:hypothetical protein GA0115240_17047 [Streptomyces sp. DvalAA-14]|nr:hypothetical protein GA0115240_17047 [Streptomyces sp. DvalAA-14]